MIPPAPPAPILLHAGPLRLAFDPTEGSLRYLCAGDREILRGIAAPIRDQAWSTVRPQIRDLRVDQQDDSFRVTFVAHCREAAVDFVWRGELTGSAEGRLEFSFDGEARSDFARNRIGFCVLHPAEASGTPLQVEHLDGSIELGVFPQLIRTGAPFTDIRALTHEIAPGCRAEVRLEGETFEMEDQRNWTDASYKTYCTTLRLPRPVAVAKGTRIRQTVIVTLLGPVPTPAADFSPPWRAPGEAVVTIGAEVSGPMPALGVTWGGAPVTADGLDALRSVRPAHLRVNLCLRGEEWREHLRAAAAAATELNCALELALIAAEKSPSAIGEAVAAVSRLTPAAAIARWIVLDESAGSTPPSLVAALRWTLGARAGSAPIGGGACDNYTELNYGPAVAAVADFTVHAVNPQVHAFDEASIVETLAIQGLTVANARTLSGGKPAVVSPVMFTRRWRSNDTGAPVGIPPNALPFQADPRVATDCCAAWTLGSIAQLARAGAASATYFEVSGDNGILGTDGTVRPVAAALALVAGSAGADVPTVQSSHPLYVEALAWQRGRRRSLVVANLRGHAQRVRITGAWGDHSVSLAAYSVRAVDLA